MKMFLGTLAVLLLPWFQATAAPLEKDEVLDSFFEQRVLIDEISDSVGREDLPALLAIRSTIGTVIEEVQLNRQTKRKPITFEILVKIQGLVIQYSFSETLLGWTNPVAITSIYTEEKAELLMKLKSLSEQMKMEYGFDQSFYTVITANIFKQMQKILVQAEDLTLEADLKLQLRALWVPIGQVASVAALGDRPKAFAAATPVIAKVRALYPMFDKLSSSNAGFPVVLQLKGLVEFFAEYAQQE